MKWDTDADAYSEMGQRQEERESILPYNVCVQ